MSHYDYDCCCCCDSKINYNALGENPKKKICANCVAELAVRGVICHDAEDFKNWLSTVDKDVGEKILKEVGFETCIHKNEIDEIYNKRFK